MLLSIIIPMHNSFSMLKKGLDKLEKCIDYSFEVIIIDDFSTDNSLDELYNYSLKSKLNLKIIKNNENLGPGLSRNKGILESSAKYITFLDSDDYFSNDFFENVIHYLNDEYDTIIFDYKFVDFNDNLIKSGKSIDSINVNEGLFDKNLAFVYTFGSTCGKIYKRSIAIENNIKYANIYRNEDMPFTKSMIFHSNRICYLKKQLYNYVQHGNSIMHCSKYYNVDNYNLAFELLKQQCDNDGNNFELDAIYLREVICPTIINMIHHKVKSKNIRNFIDEKFKKQFLKNKYFKNYSTLFKLFCYLTYYKLIFIIRFLVGVETWINK